MPVIQQGTAMIRASPDALLPHHCIGVSRHGREYAAQAGPGAPAARADHLRRRDRQRHREEGAAPGGRHPRRPLRQAGYPAGEAGRTAFRRHRPRQLQRDPLLHLSPRHPAGRQHHQRRRQQAERRAALQPHRGLRPGQPGEAGGPVASPVRSAPAPARPADQARRQRRPRPVAAGRGGQHRRPAGNQSGPPGSRSGPGRRQRTPADQPA